MLDVALRNEIVRTVKSAMVEVHEMYDEQWVTGRELGEVVSCFSPYWLKNYGRLLPRTSIEVLKNDGTAARTGYIYPLHKIQRLLAEGKIRIIEEPENSDDNNCLCNRDKASGRVRELGD